MEAATGVPQPKWVEAEASLSAEKASGSLEEQMGLTVSIAVASALSLACSTAPSPSIRAASARDWASALAAPVLSTAVLQKEKSWKPFSDVACDGENTLPGAVL